MSVELEKSQVINALSSVNAPGEKYSVVKLGMVSSVIIKNGSSVGFAIEIDPKKISGKDAEKLRKDCEQAVLKIKGINNVTAVLTTETTTPIQQTKKDSMAKIKNIIVVASGKGGVGKSTVATNLAVALGKQGYKTGLLDADILGPSIARMMGLNKKPEVEDNLIVPLENHGVKFLSIGLLVDEEAPIVWRGPMVSKALGQLTKGAKWGELDFLILDLPPGTGDIQITLSKHFPVAGAVMVTTPQEVALMDVKKAIGMFEKMHIPVLGIVNNMSYFKDTDSGKKSYVFGKGNVEETARRYGIDIIGEIPLLEEISTNSDKGTPVAIKDNRNIFNELAEKILKKLEK